MADHNGVSGKLAYRVNEAVKASGLGRSFLYERMSSGDLPSVKIGGRRLIMHDDLMRFLKGTVSHEEHPGTKALASSKKASRPKPGNRASQLEFKWRN
ncbi:MAG: helix-turn-helix domain-containing protein [Asticcacaulis sp.]|uniref:helix-turn-helix domain-containing protein n=1 Tax=Asticcacaulis sp. TaxID=1872648 RepID=UPI0025BE8F71|nr:helix-turn-helix domain-containing protein [Asticcacaulis sp.]MCA1934772.1 helix-turn-helix domain-containing protein [Asticcacaulis sp.]